MIRATSYQDQTDVSRDLLGAFSAYDHSTTAALNDAEIDALVVRLLLRLSALCSLHAPHTPHHLIETLEQATGQTAFAVANAFLEHGTGVEDGEPQRELQQEMVHFSRIVDIGETGFAFSTDGVGLKRLRASHRIPDSLKVLSELLIVMRSRLAQRGAKVAQPVSRRPGLRRTDLASSAMVILPRELPDHLVVIVSPRPRLRKEVAYYFESLLAYLTPVEATTALCAFLAEGARAGDQIELALIAVGESGEPEFVRWRLDRAGKRSAFQRALALLPERSSAVSSSGGPWVIEMSYGQDLNVCVTVEGGPPQLFQMQPFSHDDLDVRAIVDRAIEVLDAYRGPEIRSIECGHIHLDRDLDIDQEAGTAIGSAVYTRLAQVQQEAPQLTPMMDDDHVLVRLRPSDYRTFLTERLGGAPFALVPESSPVVRAIVCALYQRILQGPGRSALVRRGSNLFVELPDRSVCELFEDFTGSADTGCVLFEVALLVYRTAPDVFGRYFAVRFPRERHIHLDACEVLDGVESHDEKADRLASLYRLFAPVTDPRSPDPDFMAFVGTFLGGLARVGHLNVLEDYYEVQQRKVRSMIRFLELPLTLTTLHFNAQTGRIALAEDDR